MAYKKPLQFSFPNRMEITAVLYFLRNGVKLDFYGLDTIFEENMRVSRGMQSLGSGFPIGARSIPVGTRFSFGKSSVLYLYEADRIRKWSAPL